jgi:hypothetical protein
MKQSIAAFTALLCALASLSAARADNSALQATLQRRYAAMKVAMSAHDDEAMQALLAPDFVSIDVTGQSERAAQMIREVDSLPIDPDKDYVSTTTILSLKPVGKTAIVTQRYDIKTHKLGADGINRTTELITVSTDTWVNVNGAWILQQTETDRLDFYINGQQVTHRVRPQ